MHFGGFASKYMSRKFFMDVHPPLAKLMITLAAWAHGFRGNFDFSDIGTEYLTTPDREQVPYVAMRSVGAFFGSLLVPVAYLTLRGLSMRPASALLAAFFVLFDNALTTQSRLILLDAPLVFFVASSLAAWVFFCQIDQRAPFSRAWWMCLVATGASLGLVLSCKWVGLFTVASIGLPVVVQLWYRLGDVRTPIPTLVRHLGARAACLIVLPLTIYLTTFAIHFAILNEAGEGDSFMSWRFRRALQGNEVPDTFSEIALGSTVRIQHHHTLGGYLHSHDHKYETGSRQQQVTLYPFRDENNEWVLIRAPVSDEEKYATGEDGHAIAPDDEISRFHHNLTYVRDGDVVRLIHAMTLLRLHSHGDHRPPVSESDYQNEVTGYGFPSSQFGGDINDNWVIEIHAQEHLTRGQDRERMHTLRTLFRLRHANLGCYLYSHKVALPDWGYGQQEVTCNTSPTLPNSIWYVETNTHPLLDEHAPKVNFVPPSFLGKVLELHRVMWDVNQHLTAHHVYESRPHTWPFLRRGINFWTKHHRQVYLIGNPLVWWPAALAVGLYAVVRVGLVLRAQRGYQDFTSAAVVRYDRACALLGVAFALHYLPFFLMKRQLFLHHYLPALYISVLLLACVFDAASSRWRSTVRLYVALALAAAAGLLFTRYAPITYASRWTNRACGDAIIRSTWDFNCVDFPEDLSAYKTYDSVVNHPGDVERHGSDDDAWPFTLPSALQNRLPHPFRASETSAGTAPKAHSAVPSDAPPNVSGLDAAQRHQAVLEGTAALRADTTTSSSSSVAPI